ncbi:hypothetical protein JOB18_002432 [Solea senegalensis]|uniref:G protein-regulated inducer of neurite outgrowth C-terminal domain-containing protein n=1 Tax=Solea senegalensis TaxID=28829 RepID=A0AAV6RLR7_SOLSE|nr:uncharacterized protein LOC122758888 [Solea senegalensis]XP_043869209.1 uncharacterized protein LOC122758888 [Solea senegalensis]KAG7506303.1 hypothetical protein JOB18_002432 [Solea senegalensis]
MAKPGRPVSESYKHVCCSVSQSLSYGDETAIVGLEDEDDQSPIFSISKSSMDVVMATGAPHKRDPAWTRMSMRRSSSTNTHCEQDSAILQQLRSHMLQQVSSTNSHHLSLTTHNLDMHSPPALSEHRVANMQCCSESSGNIHSRSSTPETVVWKGGASCSSSLTQEACNPSAPESPTSKLISPPTTPSLFTSSLHTPTVSPVEPLNHQENFLMPSPATSPLQVHTSAPLTSNSSNLLQLSSTRGSFQFPSQKSSSVCSLEDNAVSDVGSVFEDSTKELHGPGGFQLPEGRETRSPERMLSSPMPTTLAEGQEVGRSGVSPCYPQLPWQSGESCLAQGCEKSPHDSSLSDSLVSDCCRCKLSYRTSITGPPQDDVIKEEGTVTSQVVLVDAEVQTISPMGSWWDLRRNIFTSNTGSHSNLGSPPGSRLNLKSSVGSNSNLVSPSSSMFPVSSEEEERHEEDQMWDMNSASSQDLERRRPCLKIHGSTREEMGRRSSMKQVQWDEDGMTWDIHGASVDPEELSTAIKKHLEFQSSPRPLRPSTKKKRAPKPPLILSVVKVMAPELNQPVMIKTSPCVMAGEGGETKQVEEEVPCGISRAEGENTKDEEDDEVYGEEGSSHPKSPLRGIVHTRKKSGIRSLGRPGWCGSSRKAND